MPFAPVATKMLPAVVAFAGAVSSRLSRTEAFHWAAVRAAFATAVRGTVQAMSGSDRVGGVGVDDQWLIEQPQRRLVVAGGVEDQAGRGGAQLWGGRVGDAVGEVLDQQVVDRFAGLPVPGGRVRPGPQQFLD